MRLLKVTRLAPTLLSSSLVVASSMTAAAQTSAPLRAVWVTKEVHFVFQGFTTKYSCDGLQSKIRNALLQLGARKDLRVDEGACSSPTGGPEPFPSVNVKLSVLQPLANNKEDAKAVLAHWKAIDLRLDKDPLWQAEDCELLEQIEHTFLPLFATRNVDYHSSCVPHQVSPGGTWLRAEVLSADKDGVSRAAAARWAPLYLQKNS